MASTFVLGPSTSLRPTWTNWTCCLLCRLSALAIPGFRRQVSLSLQQRDLSCLWGPEQDPRLKLCGTSVASVHTHRGTEAAWCCTSECTRASGPFGVTSAAAGSRTARTWCATFAHTLESDPSDARYARPHSRNAATSRFTCARTACTSPATDQPTPTVLSNRQPHSTFDQLKNTHHSVCSGRQVYFFGRSRLLLVYSAYD